MHTLHPALAVPGTALQPHHRAARRPGAGAAARRPRRPRHPHRLRRGPVQPAAGRAVVEGREPVVKLLPDPLQPVLLASIRLAGPYRALPVERELYAAIPNRHTNRLPFSDRPVPPACWPRRGGPGRGRDPARARPRRDRPRAVPDPRLRTGPARRPGHRAELARWAGGGRDRDGIPDSALGPCASTAPRRSATSRPAGPGRAAMPGSRRPRSWPCCPCTRVTGPAGCAPGRRCSGCC